MASDNKLLGQFDLVGIPPSARGMPQIEVTFDIDANGILNVNAKDVATGKEQSIEINGSSGLDEKEIEQMQKDAETHAEEDKARREEAEVRNTGDNLVYQTEKLLADQADNLTDDEKSKVEEKLATLKAALDGEELDTIRDATEALMVVSQEFGQRLYESAAQQAQDVPGGGGPEVSDDEVVDAEIVDAEIVDEQ